MASLNSIFTLIKLWEHTWFDDMRTSDAEHSRTRAELEAQMRAMGAADPECAPWVQALDVSIAEQAKYAAFYEKLGGALGNQEARARLMAERDAIWRKYVDDGQEAPDWTEPYFNPRLGPAARIHVNGQYAS
jgi:hypothetical protein